MLDIEISKNIFIKVSIHYLLGDQVHIIINKVLSKGRHNFSWNAQDQLSGVYFIRTEIGDRVEKRKIMKFFILLLALPIPQPYFAMIL